MCAVDCNIWLDSISQLRTSRRIERGARGANPEWCPRIEGENAIDLPSARDGRKDALR